MSPLTSSLGFIIQTLSSSVFASISLSCIFFTALRTVTTSQFNFLAIVLYAPTNLFFVGCVSCKMYANTLLSAAEKFERSSKNLASAFQKCFVPYPVLWHSCWIFSATPVLAFFRTIVSTFCFFITLLLWYLRGDSMILFVSFPYISMQNIRLYIAIFFKSFVHKCQVSLLIYSMLIHFMKYHW